MMRPPVFCPTLAGLVAALLFVTVSFASTQPHEWKKMPYPCRIMTQDVRAVLEDFGENMGIATTIAPDVRGTVQNLSSNGNALDFINRLTRSLNLDWYDDGGSLFVTARSDERDVQLGLGTATFPVLRLQLSQAGALDDRYLLQPGPGGTVTIAGPPAYIAAVRNRIAALNPGSVPAGTQRITVYRGTQASAVTVP